MNRLVQGLYERDKSRGETLPSHDLPKKLLRYTIEGFHKVNEEQPRPEAMLMALLDHQPQSDDAIEAPTTGHEATLRFVVELATLLDRF